MTLWTRGVTSRGWIGVDIDSTLAVYNHGQWPEVGEPVPEMLALVKEMLDEGYEVKIFTARVGGMFKHGASAAEREDAIDQHNRVTEWCVKHLGVALEVTAVKDYDMTILFDDRALTVEKNTGRVLTPNWRMLI